MAFETKQRPSDTIYSLSAEVVMDRSCLTVPQHMLVSEAARLLRQQPSHVAAVVDEDGRCVGILSSADVFRWIDADYPEVEGLPFGARPRFMTTDALSIRMRTTLFEMVLRLVNTRANGLIVLDELDRPTGTVSAMDILVAVVERMREFAKAGMNRVTARKPK